MIDLHSNYSPLPAFAATAGSQAPRIVLLGEAWGGNEADYGKPFVGEAGKELWRMLGEAMPEIAAEEHRRVAQLLRYGSAWINHRESWLAEAGIAMTNVLSFRPPDNNLESLCCKKDELPDKGKGYPYGALAKGKFLLPKYFSELERLSRELAELKPNLIVCLGNTATWATLHATAISSIRGAVTLGVAGGVCPGVKCLPTFHPAGVMRNWAWRPVVVADLMKAQREGSFSEIRRPKRTVLIDPTIEEVEEWTARLLRDKPPLVGVDIETEAGQLTHFGVARSRREALVITFLDHSRPGWSYWSHELDELRAWRCVDRIMRAPLPRKLGQNFIYDQQYLMPVGILGAHSEDLMLLSHSLWPEMQKGLGFLGSVHTDEASWKLMRHWKAGEEKADE